MRAIRDVNCLPLRQPGFVALVVLTLGVGIGATTAAVSVASSVLLLPLPLSYESRLTDQRFLGRLSAGSPEW